MAYAVVVTAEFEKDFRKLPRDVATRVAEKIEQLAQHPEHLRYRLKHVPESLRGLHKYRVGDYRILLWPEHECQRLVLYAIAHRGDIYRRLGDR